MSCGFLSLFMAARVMRTDVPAFGLMGSLSSSAKEPRWPGSILFSAL
jgi:hypothetical protein